MFSRRQRLSRAAFPAALASGRRYSSAHFSIVVPAEASGYAVVIPKKVSRGAVGRHLLKRRIMAALRSLPLPPSLIVFPRTSAKDLGYDGIQAELKELLGAVRR